ncbi:Penicillin-binding protein 2 [Anaerococcus prevotii]|uniref:Beta-lactamase n=1 Tax=Anaerococcus prevotii (strain ATCC 9321 / DSM 20548 / JCM 6508 / NCTC 11806 / PC1) TaxID=525919 RepID=C7RDS5_ANAPD|nr:penicillin-binding transpeptidase domain-containing protein [Anaerococcus prevotii]ACV29338.1 penicillin-binding protein transpeptidase [Anaerococcus prevotii DSM 20548]SUU95012.1 Penicillin-binding protein 2 [Anaerococcus prevotii]
MKKTKEKRLIFVQVLVLVLFLAIVVRLSKVMLVKGDYYRDLSDNRKVKEVDEIASRGNIYDRNGKILATSIPSFTVQLYKDQMSSMDEDKKIDNISKLVDILEEDGVNYTEDFNLRLNSFEYKDEDTYFDHKKMPMDKVVSLLIENNLIREFISSSYQKEGIEYETANTALLALKKRGIDIPCHVGQKDGELAISFKENAGEKLKSIGFGKNDHPLDVIVESVGEDESVILTILQNPNARKLAYDLLKENGLEGDLVLKDYAVKSDEDFLEKKAKLHKLFPNINYESTAADDFYEIVKNSTIEEVLTEATVDDSGEYIIPANILIEQLENMGIYANFETEVVTEKDDDKNNYSVDVSFKNPQAGSAVRELVKLADEHKLLKKLILSEDIKYMAQNANTKNNIYPNIDITDEDPEEWTYTFTKDKKDFYTYYAQKDKTNSTDDVVDILSEEKDAGKILSYIKKVDKLEDYSDQEAIGILTIDNKLNRQGNFGYRPINIVYHLDESTVLKIEEKIDKASGIIVDTIPIRNYPNRYLASHVLGYMGPIATGDEVNKYVNDRGYLRDEIIGKTGIEESYEDNLKGKNGRSLVTVDSAGNRRQTISKSTSEPGDDVYLTIDRDLQEQAEESLKGVLAAIREGISYNSEYGTFSPIKSAPNAESGAVVVSNVKTGEVLALASYPDYDPNIFATGVSASDWESLQVEEGSGPLVPRPMLNIATQTAVMPGSTFKLVTSLAALEKGLDPLSINYCHGFMDIGNRRFSCLIWTETGSTHGEENLYGAIRDSCNYYFYTLALGKNPEDGNTLGVKLELNDIRLAAEKLGLDQKTGIEINIPNETVGNIPSIGKKVEVTKTMLKKYLENNLTIFIKDGIKKTRDEYKKDIEDIVSFADDPEGWTRDKIIEFLDEKGYEPIGIYDGQIAGLADTIKFTFLNQANWDITDMLNIVIGQGQNAYTPIQMNRVMATISNGGYLNKYTLINKIANHDSKEVLFKNVPDSKRIDIKDTKHLEDIKYGALLVAQNNPILNKLPMDIGVKTGTAEVEGQNADGSDYSSYAWMIGFAPYDDPEIAVSVILTQGDTSYNVSPIVRDIVAKYFDLKVDISNSGDSSEDIGQVEYGQGAGGENPDGNDGDHPAEETNTRQNNETDNTESTEGN